MRTNCPCGCGLTIPISGIQARAIATNRTMTDADLALTYRVPLATVKHLRGRERHR